MSVNNHLLELVTCDYCGKYILKSTAATSRQLVGAFGFMAENGEEEHQELNHYYCNESCKAHYFLEEHMAFGMNRDEAVQHLQEYHGVKNIIALLREDTSNNSYTTCPECGKRLANNKALERHKSNYH